MKYTDYIMNVPDFPIEGIQFKDITPLIGDGEAFRSAINDLTEFSKSLNANKVIGPDARGFIIGAPVAYALKASFIPVRKPGKLPREVITYDYELEYGKNTLCMHKDAVSPGDKVVIIDDLLATGGTMEATIKLVEEAGAEVVGLGFMIELVDLRGRDKLKNYPIKVLMQY
ncbi:MAG: adenine phosphoribosyltransferase [Candidatus Izemoplasmatales bacterium]|jgi:adenine phosphoribosyltransferase|nr:adenine phosphoribosyltransferase [Candidatus Izemoplasmatales bacterium]MDD4069485.1 adenine phosphoribosyltransferase [Candidatus Izemoplasmatales bacterium]MDY0139677.1 adenine phosphoribosyltransferase [Candidatus Izemoplasmatales bacterium]